MRTSLSFAGSEPTRDEEFPLDFFAAVNRQDELETVASI
jgi:hypothetical protein